LPPGIIIMAMTDYIPAGRTSRIARGTLEIQVQTEYAYRPTPRLTTTVFSSGQVLHKIEHELPAPISSPEGQFKVEALLRKQHLEIMEIVGRENFTTRLLAKKESEKVPEPKAEPVPEVIAEKIPEKPVLPEPPAPPLAMPRIPVIGRIMEIDGVEKVFRLDNSGNFESESVTDEFKKRYSFLFKNMAELLEIFGSQPGGAREKGVYTVEHNRLYLISAGYEYYFVLTRRNLNTRNFEEAFYSALKS
jgi:hypothetical protein